MSCVHVSCYLKTLLLSSSLIGPHKTCSTLIGQLLQKLVCKWVQLLMDDAITPHYDIINRWHHQPLNSSIFEDKILCEGSVSTLLIQDLVSVNALLSLTCRTVALWMSPFISFLGSALHLMLSYFIRLYSFWGHLDFSGHLHFWGCLPCWGLGSEEKDWCKST